MHCDNNLPNKLSRGELAFAAADIVRILSKFCSVSVASGLGNVASLFAVTASGASATPRLMVSRAPAQRDSCARLAANASV